MNYARKALDLARLHKGVSSVLLMMKLKITHDFAEILAKSANDEYLRRVENTKRTRFKRKNQECEKLRLSLGWDERRNEDFSRLKNFCEKNTDFLAYKDEIIKKSKCLSRKYGSFYRAKLENCEVPLTEEEKELIIEFYMNRPDGHHVDHIIPISKGGKHCLSNLQYLTASENSKKGNRLDYKKDVSHEFDNISKTVSIPDDTLRECYGL